MLDVELVQEGAIPLSVRLQCPAGELLALVGPSGAGKSTVLRAIAGLTKVSQGRVTVGGTAWQDSTKGTWIDARKRRVGMVFQNYALFPHLTALRNVAEAVHHLPRAERFARATGALAKVRLTGLEARTPSQLSGGQQQRLALARALVREPDVLLLDEPFSSVDQATRERLYEQLAELRVDLRIPIVLVTHSINEAQLLADRMTVIRRGETLQTGRPAVVLSRPVTGEVARLVGFRNLFKGKVEWVDPVSGKASVAWGAQTFIDVPTTGSITKGQTLEWGIATGDVIVLKTGRDEPELSMTISGLLKKAVELGEYVNLIISHAGSTQNLRAVVTKRFFERAAIMEGEQIRIALPHDRIVSFPSD